MLDFLHKRSTITGVCYANLLDQLRTVIHEKRRGKLFKGVLLQQDNARVHTCKVAMDAVERNGYKLIPHPAYSPVPGRVAQSVGLLARKSGVLGSIPGLATYFRFSFRFFKKGSCQLLAKVCARSTG